jgi:site-specific DNA-adenine methylase
MTPITSSRPIDADRPQPLIPFLKWPGGKRWFAAEYSHLLPRQFKRYFEPFLGGGALYFHLRPTKAVLSDINPELIATYAAVKHSSVALISSVKGAPAQTWPEILLQSQRWFAAKYRNKGRSNDLSEPHLL